MCAFDGVNLSFSGKMVYVQNGWSIGRFLLSEAHIFKSEYYLTKMRTSSLTSSQFSFILLAYKVVRLGNNSNDCSFDDIKSCNLFSLNKMVIINY